MGLKTKLVLATAVAAVAAAFGASGASATVTAFSVDSRAVIQSDGSVAVTGQVQCTPGDTVDVSAVIVQTKGQLFTDGFGDSGAITCTGAVQTWVLSVSAGIGAFKPGQSSLQAEAFDLTDGTSSAVNQPEHLGNS